MIQDNPVLVFLQLRGRETGISHAGFSAALAPHKLHIVSLPRSVGKARSFRCSSLPMETHFVGLSIGFFI
ncbi:MAG: hypothetical protein IKS55_03960, partial [Oscillospiraceae bacterium]|nr:hypothetical protein [Oscillospiraceae bacterium]